VSVVVGLRNVSIVILSVFLVINRSRKLIFTFSSYVNLHLSCPLILFSSLIFLLLLSFDCQNYQRIIYVSIVENNIFTFKHMFD
jgi:hypothetical protein